MQTTLASARERNADGRVPVGHVIVSRSEGEECRAALFDELTVGSPLDETNDIFLPSGFVSRRHLRFCVVKGQVFAVDMKSTSGSFLRNQRMVGPHRLEGNDQIVVRARVAFFSCLRPFKQNAGDFVLRFEFAT